MQKIKNETILKSKILILTCTFLICFLAFTNPAKGSDNLEFHLNKPYIKNPLGEGKDSPYAKGPLWREDGFDCTTYVEAILLQHKSQNKTDFLKNTPLIRYVDGKIGFFTRAHLMEHQWIPNAIKHGFIKKYPIKTSSESNFKINLQEWFLQNPSINNKDANYKKLAHAQENLIEVSLSYIPSKLVDNSFLDTLPSLMVAFFLKKLPANSWPGQQDEQILITHMGILKDKKLYHASLSHKKVSNINLIDYLKSKPQFIGISFFAVD